MGKRPSNLNTQVITRKVTLVPIGTKEEIKASMLYLRLINKELTIAGNETIRNFISDEFDITEIQNQHSLKRGEALAIFRKLIERNDPVVKTYDTLTFKFPHINTRIINLMTRALWSTMEKNFYDVLIGKMSIPSYRTNNFPIPVELSLKKNELNYVSFSLPMSITGKKTYGDVKFGIKFGKDRSNNRIIINRILDNTYHLCGSTIQLKDNDIILNLVIKIPVNQEVIPIADKIMGIDLGINRPVSIYISGEKHQPPQINIGEKIQRERMKFYKHRRSLQQTLKYSKGGHGRNRKTLTLENLKEKESNWSKLINHTISREVIRIAQLYKVGIIKLEDLTGITTNVNDYYLKSWAYYQLQTDIQYKAEGVGIKIEWVNPANTSNTCPTCSNSTLLNRNDKDKTIFRCINNNCEDFDKLKDADIVGAFNITFTEGSNVKGKSKAGKIKKTIEKKQLLEEIER